MKKVSLFLFGLVFVFLVSPLSVFATPSCLSGGLLSDPVTQCSDIPGKVNATCSPACAPADTTHRAEICCDSVPAGGAGGSATCDAGFQCASPKIPASTCSPACTGGTICCGPAPATSATTTSTTTTTATATTGGGTISFVNPLKYATVEEVLGALLTGLQGIIVTLALVFIVVGAVLYVTSAGNDKQIETAKNVILAAMIGLAIGIAAPSFLKEISTILGWSSVPTTVSSSASIATILLNVLNFLLGIIGILAIIMLVIGGFMYLTSAGDEGRIETGKKIVIWSVVGVTVALSALIIVRQIADFF